MARACASERNAPRDAVVVAGEVVLLSSPRRKIDARRPIRDQSGRVARCTRLASASAPTQMAPRSFVHPLGSSSPSPSLRLLFASSSRPSPRLAHCLSLSFAPLHELACAARSTESTSAVIFEETPSSTSNSLVSKSLSELSATLFSPRSVGPERVFAVKENRSFDRGRGSRAGSVTRALQLSQVSI